MYCGIEAEHEVFFNRPMLSITIIAFNSTEMGTGLRLDQFTVVYLVTWPLCGNEAGVDLVLLETFLLFIYIDHVVLMLVNMIYI